MLLARIGEQTRRPGRETGPHRPPVRGGQIETVGERRQRQEGIDRGREGVVRHVHRRAELV